MIAYAALVADRVAAQLTCSALQQLNYTCQEMVCLLATGWHLTQNPIHVFGHIPVLLQHAQRHEDIALARSGQCWPDKCMCIEMRVTG